MYLSDFVSKEDRVEVTFSDFRKLVDGCSRLDALERYLKGKQYVDIASVLAIIGAEAEADEEEKEDE